MATSHYYFFPSSGGVGQMGILIALDTLLQQLKGEKNVDVYGVVLRLVRSCCLMTPSLVSKAESWIISRKVQPLDSS